MICLGTEIHRDITQIPGDQPYNIMWKSPYLSTYCTQPPNNEYRLKNRNCLYFVVNFLKQIFIFAFYIQGICLVLLTIFKNSSSIPTVSNRCATRKYFMNVLTGWLVVCVGGGGGVPGGWWWVLGGGWLVVVSVPSGMCSQTDIFFSFVIRSLRYVKTAMWW